MVYYAGGRYDIRAKSPVTTQSKDMQTEWKSYAHYRFSIRFDNKMHEILENIQTSLLKGDPTVIGIVVAVFVVILTVCKYSLVIENTCIK